MITRRVLGSRCGLIVTWNPPDHFARTLIRHMRDAVVVTDEGFRVVAWLGAAQEIFGYTADEADGKHVLAHRLGADGEARRKSPPVRESGIPFPGTRSCRSALRRR